jgi:hypothetical protein
MTATTKRTTTTIEQVARFDERREADAQDAGFVVLPQHFDRGPPGWRGPPDGLACGHAWASPPELSGFALAALGRATGVAGESGEAGRLGYLAAVLTPLSAWSRPEIA